MPVDAGGGDTGVVVPGAYMTLLTDQCMNMYVLDPRFFDTEDQEAVAQFDAREAELAARAEAVIKQRAARGDPVYVDRWLVGSNVLRVPAGVPMFARTVDNSEFMRRGSFQVTRDDVITASDLWPPLTSHVLYPEDPLPDCWRCEPREPSAERPTASWPGSRKPRGFGRRCC